MRARAQGVLVMPAEPFYPTRQGPPALRLSFGHLPLSSAAEGVSRLAAALGKLMNSASGIKPPPWNLFRNSRPTRQRESLLLEWAAKYRDGSLETLARDMQMDGDHSQRPELYKEFLDGLTADPLEPQDALDAASQFLEEHAGSNGNAEVAGLVRASRTTAEIRRPTRNFGITGSRCWTRCRKRRGSFKGVARPIRKPHG